MRSKPITIHARAGAKYVCDLKPGETWRSLPDGSITIIGPHGVFIIENGRRAKIEITGHEGHVYCEFDKQGNIVAAS